MKVVVTGGAGYIGSHTIIDIVESTNWEIVSIDSYINSTPDTYRRIKEVTGKEIEHYKVDLCDKNALKNVFNEIGAIAGVIHFAALKAVGDSVENPLLYYQNNITGLYHITNNKTIDKFKLLTLIKKYTKKNILIHPFNEKTINKSFIDTRNELNFEIPGYEEMIKEMVETIKKNKKLYSQYNIN